MTELFKLFYECEGVSTDTRNIKKNELFIALKGGNFNGNKYAQTALEKGAKYAIVDEKEYENNSTLFYVENSLLFLQKLAEHHRLKFNIPFIGITGSNGKTTTKELLAAVLSEKFKVHFTAGNLNNHIGVPLTLLQLKKDCEIAIIEMGASKLGDIKELTDIAHPTHGIITNIGTAHIEGFGSSENIVKTKLELYQALKEVKGHVFYSTEETHLKDAVPHECSSSTYGISAEAEVIGEIVNANPQVVFTWKDETYQSAEIPTKMIGDYNLLNLLTAISVGRYFGVDSEKINKALSAYSPSNNRSQLEVTKHNKLILDAYNANPTSVRAALKNFSALEIKNKLFIIGDMLELGEDTLQYHQEIIEYTKELGLQGVFVGKLFDELADKNNVLAFTNVEKAKAFFKTAHPKNNLILLKGSRGIGLEKLVEIL
ncbi:MAG TPA: UDP-N-acetylmuramoyl-tripeptide--D-alanyl-D-alanine ligase [Brumimicrobium sp.]|nr:UDP-N-acetylmuramoyl-tripeptide--D-alanyl-D-alanine ligase [Brumimicrobium sp.]